MGRKLSIFSGRLSESTELREIVYRRVLFNRKAKTHALKIEGIAHEKAIDSIFLAGDQRKAVRMLYGCVDWNIHQGALH